MSYRHISIWLRAARPKTLWAAVAPVIIGSSLAAADHAFHFLSAAAALAGALLIQIGANFSNDYFDFKKGADNDARKGPERVTARGLVPPKSVKRAFILAFGLASLAGLYLVYRAGTPVVIIGLLSIASGILYTGGPRPFGYMGLGDIFVLVFFGFTAVGGTYYVQALTINSTAVMGGLGPGLLATAILTVNNLRDRSTDMEAGKRTLAVRFGAGFARWEYLLCIVGAGLSVVWMCLLAGGHYFSLISLAALLLSVPAVRTVFTTEDGPPLNHTLALTGKVLLLFSILFSIGWLI